jgi:hypothetical protein
MSALESRGCAVATSTYVCGECVGSLRLTSVHSVDDASKSGVIPGCQRCRGDIQMSACSSNSQPCDCNQENSLSLLNGDTQQCSSKVA